MHAKCIIEVNDEAGIRPNKTFLALANEVGGPSNLGFSEKDVRNYISSTLRSTNVNADVKEMLNYFMRMKELSPNYFYAVNLNEDNKFMSAVWVDARCRASYEYYGDVVSFDTTYSTNWHGLPFAAFIGVNHHGKSTLLGCALLDSEEISSFEWVFTQWLECMGTAPKGIITDQCKSMFGTIKKFVHEFDNVLGTKEQKELEDDTADSRGLIPCLTRSAIERRFQKEYTNEMFRDVQTEFGKKADCTIRAVDEQGDSARVKVEEEILVYETTQYVTFDVHFDHSTHEVRCDCNLFESAGILCCHYLVVLSSYKVNEVPSCYVLPRWSKNIKRKHTYIKNSHDIRCSNESHNIFRGLCAHFYNVAQEFVNCDDEADILHNVLEDARAKLVDYCGRMRNNTVATTHNSIVTDPSTVFGTEDIQAPSKDNPVESTANQDSEAFAQQIAKQGLGGFMSLLNSFDNT
ncbi:protein FAR1-RELATED SEQUENCE 5-like [Arachis hypogaea]|uniref:protein FAR1-RELATED SEQUENCE 5-like n=1 Tax=Arachis hypogaea TaxID=3818 RepID=UPI000DECFDFC